MDTFAGFMTHAKLWEWLVSTEGGFVWGQEQMEKIDSLPPNALSNWVPQ